MRWGSQRESDNIEDRRGMSGGGMAIGGGGLVIVVLALVIWLFGGDPRQLLHNLHQDNGQHSTAASNSQPQDPNRQFVGLVMGSLEDTWNQILPQQARVRFVAPKLALYSGQLSPACGYASAGMGPFYCPGYQKLYLDFAFFDELK